MKYQSHLCLEEVDLHASGEWQLPPSCWSFVRVEQGQGYWLGRGENREMNLGDVFVAPPAAAKGAFRASQLTTVRLQHFQFCPELMSGLLSLTERQQFEKLAARGRLAIRVLPASHAMAKRFGEISLEQDGKNSLLRRCLLLEIVGSVFMKELSPATRTEAAILSATKRIKVLLEHLTEEEFLNASADELAAYCGCSLRHFSRLFLQHFGVSLRSRQTDMRLAKARRLLVETDSRVMTVASACGYRHLGVFNALFKKRFGMTPTQWRHQNGRDLASALPCLPAEPMDPAPAKAGRKPLPSKPAVVTET
jgi:AraC-like DNA-binding protein